MALSEDKNKLTEEISKLRLALEAYTPGKGSKGVYGRKEVQFPNQLYIGLFGRIGCGKTSLINSLKCAVSGPSSHATWFPVASPEKGGGHTLRRVIAHLTGKISVVDNRGVDDLTKTGLLEELKAQMDGKRGHTTKVNWEEPTGADDNEDFINVENRIGCAVFVFSAKHDLTQITDGLYEAVQFMEAQEGRYPVAVITNVDCNAAEWRVEALRSALQVTGISEIFKVANVTKDKKDLEFCYQHNLLSLLERCTVDSDEAAAFKHLHHKEQMANQNRQEIRSRNVVALTKAADARALEDKMFVVASGAVITGAAGGGALIGLVGGPVGMAIGAGVGAAVGGASLLVGKILGKR